MTQLRVFRNKLPRRLPTRVETSVRGSSSYRDKNGRLDRKELGQVLRQAEKLVSGQGVRYDSPTYGWDEGVVFRKGEPVTMSSDIIQVIADARDFEDEHGRDHGNGWLLNHPLRDRKSVV